MAKGKLPPRQKMINLMYLVFIAMMAMQIDREVLRSFEGINKSLVDASELTGQNNATFYDQIKDKATDDPDYKAIEERALQVKEKANEVYQLIESVKNELATKVGYTTPKEGEETNYSSLQNSDVVTNLFFRGENNSERGNELQNKIKEFKDFLLTQYSSENDKARVTKLFGTETKKGRTWLSKVFYNQPMVSALTNMTKIQTDVRTEEGNLVRTLLANKLQDEIELRAFQPIVDIPPVVRKGDVVEANIAFGAYDNTLQGNVTLSGGRQVTLSGGKATFSLDTSTDGTRTISGQMSYKKADGSTETMPFERTYTVVSETLAKAPTGGSISADKMNVVYRGINNPITATINGADGPISMSASVPGLSGSNGKYNFKPSGGSTVIFTASAKTSSGKVVTEKKEFRIKPVPPPQGQIRGQNSIVVPPSSLSKLVVEADIPNFEFPVSFTVTSFKVKVSGERTVHVSGNRLSSAGHLLDKVKPGDAVNIFDIEVTARGLDGRIPNVSGVAIDVQ